MTRTPVELHYAVRLWVLAKYIGELALVASILGLLPLAVSVIYGEYHATQRCALASGVLLLPYLATIKIDKPRRIQPNEVMVIVAAAFLLTPAVGWYTLAASGLAPIDAFFEAVSGVTTTGLSTVANIEDAPATFKFTRAWFQWYGGLGIMIFTLAMLMGSDLNTKRLGESQLDTGDAASSARLFARRILIVYTALTLAGIALLLITGLSPLEAVTYCLSAVSTGGYAARADSLAGMGAPSAWSVTLLTFLCALPLGLYLKVRAEGPGSMRRYLKDNPEPRYLLYLCVGFGLVNSWLLGHDGYRLGDALNHGFLMTLSAQTTSGFSSLAVSELGDAQKLLLTFSMAIGATVGSTGGGFKILRLLMVIRICLLTLRKVSTSSHAVMEPNTEKRLANQRETSAALLIIILFGAVTAVSWGAFLYAGYPPLDSLFEVVSALNTVGLSTGLTSAELPSYLKTVLCADMLLGRLEIMAWLIFLYPGTWFGKRSRE